LRFLSTSSLRQRLWLLGWFNYVRCGARLRRPLCRFLEREFGQEKRPPFSGMFLLVGRSETYTSALTSTATCLRFAPAVRQLTTKSCSCSRFGQARSALEAEMEDLLFLSSTLRSLAVETCSARVGWRAARIQGSGWTRRLHSLPQGSLNRYGTTLRSLSTR
jgi:hypothetical protein